MKWSGTMALEKHTDQVLNAGSATFLTGDPSKGDDEIYHVQLAVKVNKTIYLKH